MEIVAFGYKKGVGKDTAGRFLNTFLKLEAPDLRVKHVSFAAKLKDISFQLYKWAGLKRGIYYESHRDEKETLLPQLGLSPRDIWIGIGNKMREIYSNTWINFALFGVQADVLIITDLRFLNEGNAVLDAGGIVVKINRPNIPQGTDPAEVDLDTWPDGHWDYIIDNSGTLQNLNTEVEQLANHYILKREK